MAAGMVDSKSLRKAFKSGRLAGKKGSVKSVESHKLELDDGTSLDVCWAGGRAGGVGCWRAVGVQGLPSCRWCRGMACPPPPPDVLAASPSPWPLQADIVVLATGYRPIARSLLPTPELQLEAGYGDNSAGNNYEFQWLYRNVLPPQLSNIAFIGQLATFQHVLTAALQVRDAWGVPVACLMVRAVLVAATLMGRPHVSTHPSSDI